MAYNKLQNRLIMSHPSANSSNRNAESSYLHSEDWIINILKFNLILKGTNMVNQAAWYLQRKDANLRGHILILRQNTDINALFDWKKKTKSIK